MIPLVMVWVYVYTTAKYCSYNARDRHGSSGEVFFVIFCGIVGIFVLIFLILLFWQYA